MPILDFSINEAVVPGNDQPVSAACSACSPTSLSKSHSELHSKKPRSPCVVISGLAPDEARSDINLFKDLVTNEFKISVQVVKMKRLGDPVEGKIQKLLVTLSSPEEAGNLMAYAKLLRQSSDPVVQQSVFMNYHLTRAEAELAYQRRIQRRASKTDDSTTDNRHLSQSAAIPDPVPDSTARDIDNRDLSDFITNNESR